MFRNLLACLLLYFKKPVCTVIVETALRQRISELQKYRQAGLRWLQSAKLYDKMAATQDAGQQHLLDDVLHYIQVCDWLL